MSTPTTTRDVPLLDYIDQIDGPWLEAALAGNFPGARIEGFSAHPVGAGNVSDTVAVELTYAERPEGAPDSVVVKFRPSDPDVHAHGLGSGAYHREIGAYRTVQTPNCRLPRLVHVAGDETNINLVVEDLTSATPGDQVAGCSVEAAHAVLAELAGLHATFPMDPETAPDWTIKLPEVADYWTEKMQAGAAIIEERFAEDLSPDDFAAIRDGAALVRDWHHLAPRLQTLTHGDPRVDNVLFEEVDAKPRAVLIDWQVTGVRNPMYDVGYFLSGSIDIEDRRTHEDDLLQRYVDRYNAISETPYDLADARADFRVQVLSGLIITTAAIAVLPDNEVVNRLILALIRRNCAAVTDWGSIAAARAAIAG
ncbi:phosphotransferase [Nocardioides sp. AE5]|uniref:phosphotransferase family protein n=1 Tax=Nocardioides sp. AE5 TaxID=2962573 RepID=UPI002882497F|nr:phosphotransferase [Nocardioides sp. AE5]MDT0201656.1 phosphotransferase [Nocardioides sp. AE5]